MIPYDDLVAALQSWRARQGLPVAAPAAGSGPRTAPPAPAAAPATRATPPAAPPRLADVETVDEAHHDVAEEHLEEEHLIEDGHYENEGNDFAMSFAADGHNGHLTGVNGADGSETMVGHDPALEPDRPSDLTDPGAAQRNGRDDW